METMKPVDIAAGFEYGGLGNFSSKLMELFCIADLANRRKLAEAYPVHAEGFEIWFKGEYKKKED